MTDKLLIERELLERAVKDAQSWPRLDKNYACVGRGNWMPKGHPEAHEHEDGCQEEVLAKQQHWRSQLRAALTAPRQPEGELEVVGHRGVDPEGGEGFVGAKWPDAFADSCIVEPLCRLPDAQRAIAELRGEISDLHTTMMAAAVEIQEHWEAHCDEEGYGPVNLMHRLERGVASQYGYTAQTLVQNAAERDSLRQQLAERDAIIERLEAGIPRIQEQSHQMRQQRDKLAGLLRRSAPHVKASAGASHMMDGFSPRRNKLDELSDEIDAALAEVNK